MATDELSLGRDPTWSYECEREMRQREYQREAAALIDRIDSAPEWLADWKDYRWSYEELEWLKAVQWPGGKYRSTTVKIEAEGDNYERPLGAARGH